MAKSPLIYLKEQLNDDGNFLGDYRRLPDSDKETLKKWAAEEMVATGVEVSNK